ncbi:MAG: molybdopterin-guanine dinucleotide biosynthesis protein B [Hadesarchaea archaeon]|nr:molybdopterin-guanine dinucleotide biosynthesis protein B [Hadesarchaea archaeon]
MIRALAVVGFKESGKTQVVEGLVRELTRRGHHVGTVKHVRERGFTIDRPGKDTWRHARAGARLIVSVAPRELATIEKRSAGLVEAVRRLRGLDFIIIEGFREFKGIARVAIARNASEVKKLADEFTIACVGVGKRGLPKLGPQDSKRLANLVERKAFPLLPGLDCEYCGYKSCREFGLAVLGGKARWDGCGALRERAVLTIDGKRVPLNPFVQELIANMLAGMLSSLKGGRGKQIELKVVKE